MKRLQFSSTLLLAVMSFTVAQSIQAATHDMHADHSGHDHSRPDSHAPIGVVGDHLMREDEIMLSYRFMRMDMDGNRDGANRVSTPLPGYMVSPTSMVMDMHMLSAMYAPSDKLTLMLMLPFTSISMDHVRHMGSVNFTTEASGVGDVKLAATYGLFAKSGTDFMFNMAISLPTGSIDERDEIPTMPPQNAHLPYPMQLGSGTYDLIPGLTYVRTYDDWSWGAQGLYTLRTGTNDNDYTLGDKLEATSWVAKQVASSTSLSFRLKALDWDNIDGADSKLLAKPTVSTKDPNLRAGSRVDALIGVNFVPTDLDSLRLALEVGVPVYQKLDGPQLETDLVFTLGAQYTF